MRAFVLCVVVMAVTGRGAARRGGADRRPGAADFRQQIDQLRQEFNNRLTALEMQLASIQGGQQATTPPAAPPEPALPAAPPALVPEVGQGGALANSKVFNPDMAVIGNFLGAAGKNTVNPQPGAADARSRSVVPGGRRSLCARRFLPLVRRRRRRARRGLHHVHRRCPASC